MTHEAVSFEEVFHWTKFLAFESQKFLSLSLKKTLKLEFNVKMHCEINVKLYFMKYSERKISQCILPFRNYFQEK